MGRHRRGQLIAACGGWGVAGAMWLVGLALRSPDPDLVELGLRWAAWSGVLAGVVVGAVFSVKVGAGLAAHRLPAPWGRRGNEPGSGPAGEQRAGSAGAGRASGWILTGSGLLAVAGGVAVQLAVMSHGEPLLSLAAVLLTGPAALGGLSMLVAGLLLLVASPASGGRAEPAAPGPEDPNNPA